MLLFVRLYYYEDEGSPRAGLGLTELDDTSRPEMGSAGQSAYLGVKKCSCRIALRGFHSGLFSSFTG